MGNCVTSAPTYAPSPGILDLEARVKHWLWKNQRPWLIRHLRPMRHEVRWQHVKFTPESVPKETFKPVETTEVETTEVETTEVETTEVETTEVETTAVETKPDVSRHLTTVKCSSVAGNASQTHSCKISRDVTATRKVTFTSSVRLSSDLESADTQLPLQVPEAVGHLGVQTMPVSYVGGYQQLDVKNRLELSSDFSVPPGQTRNLRIRVCEKSHEYNFKQKTRITGRVKIDFYRRGIWEKAKEISIAELFRRTSDFSEHTEFKLEQDYVDVSLKGHVIFQTNTVVEVATV